MLGCSFNCIASWVTMLMISPKKVLSNHSETAEVGEERRGYKYIIVALFLSLDAFFFLFFSKLMRLSIRFSNYYGYFS